MSLHNKPLPPSPHRVRRTSWPYKCPHCAVPVYKPQSWLRVLAALSPGAGGRYAGRYAGRFSATVPQIAVKLRVKRETARGWVLLGLRDGVIERIGRFGFGKTVTGELCLCAWKRSGWECL